MPRDSPTKVSAGEEVSPRMDSWGSSVPGRGYEAPWGRSWPGWSRSRTTRVKEERSSCEDPAFSVSEMGAAGGLGMEDIHRLGLEQDPLSVCVDNRL